MRLPMIVAFVFCVLQSHVAAQDCAGAEGEPCQVASGQYRIALPSGEASPGAMIWLHGMGGSANGVMKNKGMVRAVLERGMVLIAPDGLPMSETRKARNWTVNDGWSNARDEIAFLSEVIDDAVARHGIDRDRILLGGFSRGGSMVWDVACRAPDLARAYVPVAGAFWEPMWQDCEAPVDLFHTHGWTDRTVPLEGRPLRGGALVQGDVFQSLYILRATNGCANRQPEDAPLSEAQDRWYRSWAACQGGRIDLMLHPGGHGIPKGWLGQALDWFEARLEEDCTELVAQSGVAPACG